MMSAGDSTKRTGVRITGKKGVGRRVDVRNLSEIIV